MLQEVNAEWFYRNIKTQTVYKVIAIGFHSETLEPLVIYREDIDGSVVYIRPLELFKEKFELI